MVFEKIRELIAEKIECSVDEIQEDTEFEALGIDSLDVAEVVINLEEVDTCRVRLISDDVQTFLDRNLFLSDDLKNRGYLFSTHQNDGLQGKRALFLAHASFDGTLDIEISHFVFE